MLKLTVFIIALLTLCAIDLTAMRRQGHNGSAAYVIIAATAALAAAVAFLEPYGGSMISVMLRLMRVSE